MLKVKIAAHSHNQTAAAAHTQNQTAVSTKAANNQSQTAWINKQKQKISTSRDIDICNIWISC